MIYTDTIVALATPSGAGAIAVIRLSGDEAISIASGIFFSISKKCLKKQKSAGWAGKAFYLKKR